MDTPSYALPEDSPLLDRLRAEFAPKRHRAKRSSTLGPWLGVLPSGRCVDACCEQYRAIEKSFSGHLTEEIRPIVQSLVAMRELSTQALQDGRLDLFDRLQRHVVIAADTLSDVRKRFKAKPPMTDEEHARARKKIYEATEKARRRFARRVAKGQYHEPTNP